MDYVEYKVTKMSARQDVTVFIPKNALLGSITEFTIGGNPGWEIVYLEPVEG